MTRPQPLYPLKSATPSHINCTAIARIRNPKMRLIAPAALGPSRPPAGLQTQKKINRKRQRRDADHHAEVSSQAVDMRRQPITTPIEPGPESMGMAIGVREMSALVMASSLSAVVSRFSPVTIPQAVLATIRPPAIFKTGSEIPKNSGRSDRRTET